MSMGVIMAPGALQTPELGNHWADSHQIKFTGTFSASRCAILWSFVHWGHMGVSMGVIKAPEICNKDFWNHADARTQQPLGRFTPNQVL